MDTSQLLKQITSYVDSGISSSLMLPSLIKSLTMEQQQEILPNFLEGDMPNKYSIALILILSEVVKKLQKIDIETICSLIRLMASNLNKEHANLAKKEYFQIFTLLCKHAQKDTNDARNIKIVFETLVESFKTNPFKQSITPFNIEVLKFALLQRGYKEARVAIVMNPTPSIPFIESINVEEAMTYHYYAAMNFIGLRQFQDAFTYLTIVLTWPGNLPSQIAIEAFKKYVFVSVIAYGKYINPPPFTTVNISAITKNCSSYMDFVYLISSSLNPDTIRKRVTNLHGVFLKDSNLRLCIWAMVEFDRRLILKVVKVYKSIPVEKLKDILKIEEPRNILHQMKTSNILDWEDENDIITFKECKVDENSSVRLNGASTAISSEAFIQGMEQLLKGAVDMEVMLRDVSRSVRQLRVFAQRSHGEDAPMLDAAAAHSITRGDR
eukprot:TRINITY_DN1052_c0_g1_i5.p1 TRINITY_DN1052_c0_g1~~TRINITY_DN1052_c0_g1_i5.p1  ORF type:complete len:438 (-),score=96.85 TRINITY_DN1052_c0_g1_i5:78-1391(-)